MPELPGSNTPESLRDAQTQQIDQQNPEAAVLSGGEQIPAQVEGPVDGVNSTVEGATALVTLAPDSGPEAVAGSDTGAGSPGVVSVLHELPEDFEKMPLSQRAQFMANLRLLASQNANPGPDTPTS
ncbi:MAG: hypothetical protein WCO52_03160 [bacterium]